MTSAAGQHNKTGGLADWTDRVGPDVAAACSTVPARRTARQSACLSWWLASAVDGLAAALAEHVAHTRGRDGVRHLTARLTRR